MKRYILFSGAVYYPTGGWEDFRGWFDTVEEALASIDDKDDQYSWYQIIDTTTWEEVRVDKP